MKREIMMALGKQAKTLTDKQMKFVLSYIADTRDPLRNKVMFLLSVDAALRACEIASVEWSMVCDCLLYTSPSPRDRTRSRMPSSA